MSEQSKEGILDLKEQFKKLEMKNTILNTENELVRKNNIYLSKEIEQLNEKIDSINRELYNKNRELNSTKEQLEVILYSRSYRLILKVKNMLRRLKLWK